MNISQPKLRSEKFDDDNNNNNNNNNNNIFTNLSKIEEHLCRRTLINDTNTLPAELPYSLYKVEFSRYDI